MMETLFTRKILTGIILFLILTNVVTVLTVSYRNRTAATASANLSEKGSPIPDNQRTRFFTRELDLNTSQQDQFRKVHMDYMRNARDKSHRMDELRKNLLEAMNRPHPDSLQLDNLSDEIGTLHAELKKLTIGYYLGLKEVCTQEQQQRLYELFRQILTKDGEDRPRGPGPPAGGRGRGPWWLSEKDSLSN